MKLIVRGLFVAAILSAATTIAAQSTEQPNKQLSEISKLRAENLKLKAQLNSCSLSSEQLQLEMSFRKELDAKDNQKFDWNAFSFIDPIK